MFINYELKFNTPNYFFFDFPWTTAVIGSLLISCFSLFFFAFPIVYVI